jgi:hypothetical protein
MSAPELIAPSPERDSGRSTTGSVRCGVYGAGGYRVTGRSGADGQMGQPTIDRNEAQQVNRSAGGKEKRGGKKPRPEQDRVQAESAAWGSYEDSYFTASRKRANTFQNAASCVVAKLIRISVLGARTA